MIDIAVTRSYLIRWVGMNVLFPSKTASATPRSLSDISPCNQSRPDSLMNR